MASEQHVEEVTPKENEKAPTKKMRKTVLDNFSNLVKPQDKIRIKSSVYLLKHLAENENEDKSDELKYALGRIIRGLGSSTVSARTGFYTALVALINIKDVSVDDIFQHFDKQLQTAGSNTKGENADVCMGKILTCGAIMRSKLWSKIPGEQKKIMEILLKTCKERIYLTLVAYMFITDAFKEAEEKDFKRIFQLIKVEISKPWADYDIDTLYLLLSVKNKDSNYVKSKFLQSTVGTRDIICPESLEELCSILTTIPRVTSLKHPVYDIISKDLAASKHLTAFIWVLDGNLRRPNRNKLLVATKIYSSILQSLNDDSVIPDVLSNNFVQQTLNYFKTCKGKDKDPEFQQSTNRFFAILLEALRKDGTKTETKISVLRKLLFYPGTFVFEKITRTKIIQQITLSLDGEGVKTLANVYEGVVKGTERIDSQNEHWLNNDRLYAAHLVVKLLNHAAVRNENAWKTERLGFLMHLGLFRTNDGVNVGSELAASLRTAFFGSLDVKLPKLEDLQHILSRLVKELDSKLTRDNLDEALRSPVTTEDYETWQKTVEVVTKIEKKKKRSGLKSVFLTLFLHVGLQLFNDTKLATDSLRELFVCYEKTRKGRKNSDNVDETEGIEETEGAKNDDLEWIEVVTDLFLNFLSHNSHLLRSLIRCVFPHLCRYMTATTIHQILSVIDPRNEDNPLSKRSESSDAESEEEEEDGDEAEEENGDEEEEDGDEEEEEGEGDADDEDMGDETVTDKLRMALHRALGDTGRQSDEESVDLDEMSETEGEKLDSALAEVFRQFRPNRGKSRKQSKDQETLTHFRVRALDLIEIYLDSAPSMLLTLEIMLPLLQAVEFSVRDEHQRPLHDRLKSCLKKLSSVKKFGDCDGVDENVLTDLLRSLLEKGTKNSLIIQDMGLQIADCCVFVIRCSDVLSSLETATKKTRKQLKMSIATVLSTELENYFHKRDCLTPYVLFKNAVQLSWDGTVVLVPSLLGYVFSDDVKPFKKNQALELLRLFYGNRRYLDTKPGKIKEELSEEHLKFSSAVDNFLKSLCRDPEKNVKEKFISNLFNVLSAMKTSRLDIDVDWARISDDVREYRSFVTFSNDAKSAFNRLCAHLKVSNVVEMKPKTIKTNNSLSDDDESGGLEKKESKKKKKTKNKDKLKLKREAKELRLKSLSEGFHDLDFASAKDIEANESDSDEKKSSKKRRRDSENRREQETNEGEREQETNEGERASNKKKSTKRRKGEEEEAISDKTEKKKRKTSESEETTGINGVSSKKDGDNRRNNTDSKPKKKKKVIRNL